MHTAPKPAHHLPAILRLPEVRQITGLSTSDIYRRIAAGTFPRQVKLGARSAGWIEGEVRGWVSARIAERDGG